MPPTVRASGAAAACFRWAYLPLPRRELQQRPRTGVRSPDGRLRAASLHVALLAKRPPLSPGAHTTTAPARGLCATPQSQRTNRRRLTWRTRALNTRSGAPLAPSNDFLRLTRERGASEASLQTSVVTLECRTQDGCVVLRAFGGAHAAPAGPNLRAAQCHRAFARRPGQRCARGRQSVLRQVAGAAQHIRQGAVRVDRQHSP